MKSRFFVALAAVWMLLVPGQVAAQDEAPSSSPQLLDRIVAVVDEEPILLSDLEREIESYRFELQSGGAQEEESPAGIRRAMLDRLIEIKLLVAQAKLDGLVIGEEELAAGLERAMRDVTSRFGSREALERELAKAGMRYEDLEARNRELVRNRMYTSRIVEAYVRPKIEVRDDEVRAFYEENRDDLPRRPTTVTLGNILIVPQPDEATRDRLRARLAEIREVLGAGVSFDEVARQFSEGPNAESGGTVGTFKRGDLFSPVLEQVAWNLAVGQVSEPINTELGTHLIQVTERGDDDVTLRQILLRVEIDDSQRDHARERADEVARLASGGQDFAELARNYSDDPASTEAGGVLGTFEVDQLSPAFAQALEGMEIGDVSEPIAGAAGFFVLKLLDQQPGAVYSFEEIEGRLRDILYQQKAEAELEVFVDGLREQFFIEEKA